jgi:predicted ribosomally synthesized peptide with SipW-like signal peptide
MKKRSLMLGTAIMLAVLLVAGGTMAWFTASTEPVENEFTAGTLMIELVDEFEGAPNVNPGDCYAKDVYVINTGTKRALVRIEKDMVLNSNPNGPADIALDIGVVEYELGQGWVEDEDGYFYYEDILLPGENGEGERTTSLFAENEEGKNICFAGEGMDNDYQGAELTITIEAEAIQATNGAPTEEGWKFDPLAEEEEEEVDEPA